MDKPRVKKEEQPLLWSCNEAFHRVRDLLPQNYVHSLAYNRILAFGLGFASGYGAACVGKFGLEAVGMGEHLDTVALCSLGATLGTPPIAFMIAPKEVNEWERHHPRYPFGVLGVMAGASVKSLVELL